MYYQKRLIHYLLENKIDIPTIKQVTVSSVVPQINSNIQQLLDELFSVGSRFIRFDSMQGLIISTDNPDEMGTDLIANAVSANHKFAEDAIVVDFGTALTFTCVTGDLNILGVAIAPGLFTALKSLHGGTAQLPEVGAALPKSTIGKNTTHAIQAGVFRGYIGLVKEVIAQIESEIGHKCKRIATGGLSGVLDPLQSEFDLVDKNLTLDGIRLIGEQMK